ncbi:hypothetical protein BJV78DRAFT_1212872, partial [Lactifluus subvellereus]
MPPSSPACITHAPSVVIAVVSLTCIALSLSLHEHYDPKADLCVLITFTALCPTASITACVRSNLSFPSRGSDLACSMCNAYPLQILLITFISVFVKRLFHSARVPTSVALECIWTMCL